MTHVSRVVTMDPFHKVDKFSTSKNDFNAKINMAWHKLQNSQNIPKHYSIAQVDITSMINQYYAVTFVFVCDDGTV